MWSSDAAHPFYLLLSFPSKKFGQLTCQTLVAVYVTRNTSFPPTVGPNFWHFLGDAVFRPAFWYLQVEMNGIHSRFGSGMILNQRTAL